MRKQNQRFLLIDIQENKLRRGNVRILEENEFNAMINTRTIVTGSVVGNIVSRGRKMVNSIRRNSGAKILKGTVIKKESSW